MEPQRGARAGARAGEAPPRRPFHADEPCRNCGDPSPGNYCPACGQAKRDVRVSVWALCADILEDQLVLSRALPRTLRALLLHPGHLTREYLDGRRARYLPPFRLYLAFSVLFFLLFTMFGLRPLGRGADDLAAQVDSALATVAPSPDGAVSATDSTVAGVAREIQPWARTLRVDMGSEETSARVRQRAIDRFGHLPAGEALAGFLAEYLRYVPQTVFVLLPVFALLLWLLHLGTGRFYAEHFVFALHLHAFVFAAALPGIAIGWRIWSTVLGPVIALYAWLALRRVYATGVVTTTLRWAALGLVYIVVLTIGLAVTFLWTFLRL